ncbi:HotDog domain-containing protein [Jackrogersella minutella]|nr:HotDog domain-containing protein [Jackrogersella minutella]
MLVGSPRAAQLLLRPAALPRLSIRPRPVAPAPSQLRLFAISPRRSAAEPPKNQDPLVATAVIPPPLDTSTPPPPRRRRRRGLFYSAAFLLVGLSLGSALRFTLAPPPLPAPGSPEDEYLSEAIRSKGTSLAIVEGLSGDPAWTSWDAYSGYQSAQLVRSRITTGPLSGSRGLPFQRVFHNPATGEVRSIVYLGPATAGWPGVVHGGALATVLDESLGRCAILRFPSRTGVTARLEMTYRRPTLTAAYYVVRTRPIVNDDDDVAKRDRKLWVEGTLETVDGKVCVEAKALFVVPKGVNLKPLVEGF